MAPSASFSPANATDGGPRLDAAGPTANLFSRVRLQLDALSEWGNTGAEACGRLVSVFEALTGEALDRPANPPFPGLSFINADGLPFQWVFRFSRAQSGFGFVCESGKPGDSPQQRLEYSLERFNMACDIAGVTRPSWFRDVTAAIMPPGNESLPAHWRSAMWMGVAASRTGIQLKPYLNLNRGTARERWMRAGWTLKHLGRLESLERLCAVSHRVSADSWPVGLAFDILPNGEA